MSVRIITNNVPRPVIDAWELTSAERAEFDYIDWDAVERGEASASFFRYHGELYDLGDGFETTYGLHGHGVDELLTWDGYQSDSFFSGLVIRYVDDFEYVIVGRYMS